MFNIKKYINFVNESKLNSHLKILKDYLTKPLKQKIDEFNKLFPNKNYNGLPDKEDIEKSKKYKNDFDYIRNGKVVNIDYPTHYYFTYLNDIENKWLIHFTNFGIDVFKDQCFKFGENNYKKLGYTNRHNFETKKQGGYNFAYELDDAIKYGFDNNKPKYGKDIIFFKAEGIKVKTWLNNENQIIFWGKDATNINLVVFENGKWIIKTKNKSFNIQNLKKIKLFDYNNLLSFSNLKDVYNFFKNDSHKYKNLIY